MASIFTLNLSPVLAGWISTDLYRKHISRKNIFPIFIVGVVAGLTVAPKVILDVSILPSNYSVKWLK